MAATYESENPVAMPGVTAVNQVSFARASHAAARFCLLASL
jgi:hypothetical protein